MRHIDRVGGWFGLRTLTLVGTAMLTFEVTTAAHGNHFEWFFAGVQGFVLVVLIKVERRQSRRPPPVSVWHEVLECGHGCLVLNLTPDISKPVHTPGDVRFCEGCQSPTIVQDVSLVGVTE